MNTHHLVILVHPWFENVRSIGNISARRDRYLEIERHNIHRSARAVAVSAERRDLGLPSRTVPARAGGRDWRLSLSPWQGRGYAIAFSDALAGPLRSLVRLSHRR